MATPLPSGGWLPRSAVYAALLGIPLIVSPCRAADTSFTGSLERVMEQSITILLPDARLIDAKLPDTPEFAGKALAAKYHLGDQVTIECIPIRAFWDEASKLWRALEMENIRFLRRPKPEELSKAIQCRDWRVPGNLLAPPEPEDAGPTLQGRPPAPTPSPSADAGADPQVILEKARTVNLERAAHLPNFVADEIVDCYSSPSSPPEWQHTAAIRSEVTFAGMGETRQRMTADGKPVPGHDHPGCVGWGGGFGTYLKPIFDAECRTTLEFSKSIGRPGNQALIYNFSTPPEGCFPTSFSGYERAYPAHEGFVVIEIPGGRMIHVTGRSVRFPGAYPIVKIEEKVNWNVVKIGDQARLLPIAYEKSMYMSSGWTYRVSATYTNHRHFEANSDITFH
jgi:hypothetical protein